jgi:alpha-galactosidase
LELVKPHVQNHEYTLEAAMTCNKELVVKAFLNDPLVKGKVTEEECRKLVDDMIRNTITYLPSQWKELV